MKWYVYTYPSEVVGWQLVGEVSGNITNPQDYAQSIRDALYGEGIDVQVKLKRVQITKNVYYAPTNVTV